MISFIRLYDKTFLDRGFSMTKTGKIVIMSLITAFLIGIGFATSVIFASGIDISEKKVNDAVYQEAENTLMDYLGYNRERDVTIPADGYIDNSLPCDSDGLMTRMTQRVTIMTDDGILPISGKLVKQQDVFYPGTYELKFSNNATLTETARIQVRINVRKGEPVYILTGDKDHGYTEYDVVEACGENCVVFNSGSIRDYTISTTDIQSAQEAMASIVKSR